MTLLLIAFSSIFYFVNSVEPDICLDFYKASQSVLDQCGTDIEFTRTVGITSGPFCDTSGCNFDSKSNYHAQVAGLFQTQWTIIALVAFHSQPSAILEIKDAATTLLSIAKTATNFEIYINDSGFGVSASSQMNEEKWEQVYITSTGSKVYFGFALASGELFQSLVTSGSLDLSTATQIFVGNAKSGQKPLKILRRLQFYSNSYTQDSIPNVRSLYRDQKCRDAKGQPFCDVSLINAPLKPSTISSQIVDAGPNAYAFLGRDENHTVSDPRITLEGPSFQGNEKITINGFSFQSSSFSLQMWVLFDPNFWSADQTILQISGPTSLIINVKPHLDLLYISSLGHDNNQGTLSPVSWNFLNFAVMPYSSTDKNIVSLVNGQSQFQQVTLGLIHFTSLILGSTLYGKMKDFILYESYMGSESFSDTSKCKAV